jgi:hypothetical protein
MLSFVIGYSHVKMAEQVAGPDVKVREPDSFILKASSVPTFNDCYQYATNQLKKKEVKISSITQMQLVEIKQIPTTAKTYLNMSIVLGS